MAAGDGYNNAFRWDCCSEGQWDIEGFSHELLFRWAVG